MKTIKNLLTIILLATLIIACEAESITDLLTEDIAKLETAIENPDITNIQPTSNTKEVQNQQRVTEDEDDIPNPENKSRTEDEDDIPIPNRG